MARTHDGEPAGHEGPLAERRTFSEALFIGADGIR